jgi:hypothetical protein
LHAFLEAARPEVIFLEIPSGAGADIEDARSNLESKAVRRYRDAHEVVLVPVDLPTPDEAFFRNFRYLDRRIVATSPAYCQLVDQNSHDIAVYGFPYLNSERCSDAWANIYEAMQEAVQRLKHDTSLGVILETWKHTNELRDRAMLAGMDDWCLRCPFEVGVLLVGAAHRRSLIDKSRSDRGSDTPRIEPAVFEAL